MLLWLVGFTAFSVGFVLGAAIFLRRRNALRDEVEQARVQAARSEALLLAEEGKTVWTNEARAQLREAFSSLASDEFAERSEQLRTAAKNELDSVVSPLRKELTKLDGHVRGLESKREGAYSELGTQLELLQGQHDSLRQQTTALAEALKSSSVRGRWGEVQLRRLVELAGMQKHVDFDEQVSGAEGRPDMLIRLPQGGILPVDSKVSLDAFLKAMESEDDATRKGHFVRHAQAVRTRVRELSNKAYWDQFEKAPEVVVMFVPIEASIGAAFLHDEQLFEFAFGHKVLVSSPVVLFALLKTMAYGWQQHQVAENAAHIAEEARALYDRLSTFAEHLVGTGKALGTCVERFNQTVGSFEGRLLPSAQRLSEMGVASGELAQPQHVGTQPSRLLKNTRIGLFSWPSCVSRPPRQRCARGHAVPTRGPATPAAGDQGHLASRFRNRTK